jgi:galacturonokinase
MEFPPFDAEKEKLTAAFALESGRDKKKVRLIASPYRISPLGAHIDHQGGPVLGMTVDAYTLLAYIHRDDGRVCLRSLNYPGQVNFQLAQPEENTGSFWGVYARGAALALKQTFAIQKGIEGLIAGHLPGGGLSSSASVLLAYLSALADANGVELGSWDFIKLTQSAENTHIGLKNGILDQTSIVFGRSGKLLHIDTLKPEVTAIEQAEHTPAYRILIAYSGYSRELTASGYNSRVSECKEAARMLSCYDERPVAAERLIDIPKAAFDTHGHKLPGHLFRRARHFFNEVQRVGLGIQAWKEGSIEAFGRMMVASCRSSMEDYECGSQPIHDLQQIVSQTDGVYGSRFSGGGFGGCVVGFVSAVQAEDAAAQIKFSYQARHPEVADQVEVYLANSVSGLGRP